MSLLLAFVGTPPATVCIAAMLPATWLALDMRRNVAGQVVCAQMNARADGAPLSAGVSVVVLGDGGAQAAGAGTLTHEGNGSWSYAPTQAETNFAHVAFTFTHASGVNQTVQAYPVSYDPSDAAGLGLSRIDVAISTRLAAASYTAPDNASIATILGDTNDIQTRLPAALVSGRIDANVLQERGKYANGAVWVSQPVNTNTVSYVDGITTNPVSTIAAALTIANALGLRRFYTVRSGDVQIGATISGYDFDGDNWGCTTTGGSQDVGLSTFRNARVTGGTFASTGGVISWADCEFATGVTVGQSNMIRCTFAGTLTISAASTNYDFVDCASAVAGSGTPVFDVASLAGVNMSFRRWSGGMRLTNLAATTVVSIDVVSGGTITLEGNSGATVNIRGMVNSVVNTAGCTVNSNALLNQAVLATSAALAQVQSDTDDIQARLPAALIGGRMDSNVQAIAAGAITPIEAPALANLDATVSSRLAAAGYTAPDNTRIVLIEKLLRNKLITDPVTGIATLYDDDNTTPLLTAQLYETAGVGQTYRGQGAERRERFT